MRDASPQARRAAGLLGVLLTAAAWAGCTGSPTVRSQPSTSTTALITGPDLGAQSDATALVEVVDHILGQPLRKPSTTASADTRGPHLNCQNVAIADAGRQAGSLEFQSTVTWQGIVSELFVLAYSPPLPQGRTTTTGAGRVPPQRPDRLMLILASGDCRLGDATLFR